MDSGIIIGALALFTIGATLASAILHFGYFLKDPRNREAAETVAKDRESATTRVAGNTGEPDKGLRQRLDDSPASRDRTKWFGGAQPLAPYR